MGKIIEFGKNNKFIEFVFVAVVIGAVLALLKAFGAGINLRNVIALIVLIAVVCAFIKIFRVMGEIDEKHKKNKERVRRGGICMDDLEE